MLTNPSLDLRSTHSINLILTDGSLGDETQALKRQENELDPVYKGTNHLKCSHTF
jgi:hypothetical protein